MASSRGVGFLAAAAIGLVTAAVRAEVDAEVPLALKAKGTVLPEGEVEILRFESVEGTAITLKLSAAGRASAAPAAVLVGPGPAVVPVPDAAADPRKVQWKAFPLPATGAYAVEVTAAGTGAYSLSLTGKPKARFGSTLALDAAGTGTVAFSAPPGSALTLDARAAAGSAAVPRLRTLDGPGGSEGLAALGKRTAVRHSVALPGVAVGGDFLLEVANEGAAGTVVVGVRVRPLKARTVVLDVRASTLGRPEGGETFLRRMLGTTGGALVCDEDGCDLEGVRAVLPGGCLASRVGVVLSSSEAPGLADDDVLYAGPALSIGPAGLGAGGTFELTMPIDPRRLPRDAGLDDVRILVSGPDGERTVVPDAVHAAGGTVTLMADGPCTVVPVVPAGMPRVEGVEYRGVFLRAALHGSPDGDSRARSFELAHGSLVLSAGGTGAADVGFLEVRYDNRDGAVPGTLDAGAADLAASVVEPLDWQYGPDGRTVLVGTAEESLSLVAGRDGSVLVGRTISDGGVAGCQFLVRKPDHAPTVAGVAGSYHLAVAQWGAPGTTGSGAARFRTFRLLGTLRLDADGGGSLAATTAEARPDEARGVCEDVVLKRTLPATWEVAGDGAVRVGIPDAVPGAPPLRLRLDPSDGARILVGYGEEPAEHEVQFAVGVRQGSGLSPASLVGDYAGSIHGMESSPRSLDLGGEVVFVPDYAARTEAIAGTFSATRSATVRFDVHAVRRDGSEPDGVLDESESGEGPVDVAVTGVGRATLSDDRGHLAGAVASDAGTILLATDPAAAHLDLAIGLLVKPPPAKP